MRDLLIPYPLYREQQGCAEDLSTKLRLRLGVMAATTILSN